MIQTYTKNEPKVKVYEYKGDLNKKSEEHLDVKKSTGKKLPETGDPLSLTSLGFASLIGARKLRRKR